MNMNQQMSPQQLIQNSKSFNCENCGGMFFKQVMVLRTLSRLVTGSPQDQLVPFPVFRCDDCGTPIQDMIPREIEKSEGNNKDENDGNSLKLIT